MGLFHNVQTTNTVKALTTIHHDAKIQKKNNHVLDGVKKSFSVVDFVGNAAKYLLQ